MHLTDDNVLSFRYIRLLIRTVFRLLFQEITVERDGINLGALRDEYRFDYNHQSGVDPNVAVRTLAPGDRLRATCHFDTSTV